MVSLPQFEHFRHECSRSACIDLLTQDTSSVEAPMTASIPVGPYRQIPLKNGRSAPFYMMPFDEDGLSTARKTKAHLVDDAKQHSYSNIYIFSHGWNTDFETAL